MSLIEKIVNIRVSHPEAVGAALRDRRRGAIYPDKPLMVIACDHPARGALGAGSDPLAMASREDLLQRCVTALSRPGVNGFLGSPDMVEDLTLLGALEGKVVWGSMNRVGIQGASFEMDDRFAAYDAAAISRSGLDGGKMLVRINYRDPHSASTMESAGHAISELADRGVMAMVEPFISRWEDGHIVNDLSPEAVIRSISIVQGLGNTSAFTWLKLPCVANMERVMESTTLPSLILGGEVSKDPKTSLDGWAHALSIPNVKGLVIGRSLLYPPDDDVEAAVDRTVEIL